MLEWPMRLQLTYDVTYETAEALVDEKRLAARTYEIMAGKNIEGAIAAVAACLATKV